MNHIITIFTIAFYLPAVVILSPFVMYSFVKKIKHDTAEMGKELKAYYLNDAENAKKYFGDIMELFKKLKPFAIVISALFYFIIFQYFTA